MLKSITLYAVVRCCDKCGIDGPVGQYSSTPLDINEVFPNLVINHDPNRSVAAQAGWLIGDEDVCPGCRCNR